MVSSRALRSVARATNLFNILFETISCLLVTCSTEGLVAGVTILTTQCGLVALLARKASSSFRMILAIIVSFFFESNTMVYVPILINQGIQGFSRLDWRGSRSCIRTTINRVGDTTIYKQQQQNIYTTATTTTLTRVLHHHEVQCRSGTVGIAPVVSTSVAT
jgi:hypothetical protein